MTSATPDLADSGPRGDRVHSIEVIPIALPVRREWKWRGLAGSLGRSVILRVRTQDGREGFGEAVPQPDWGGDFNRYSGETPTTVAHTVTDLLGPEVTGLSPFDVELILQRMDAVLKGHTYAKAAIEMAMYDLQGKIVRQPVYNLIGGRAHDNVRIAHMIGLMNPDEAEEEIRGALSEGTRAFQIKGTGELAHDVDLVKHMRQVAGPGVALRFDANQGYRGSGAKCAIAAVRALAEAGIDMVEQPTEGWAQMSAVCAAVDITVIADESSWQPQDVVGIAALAAADAISIYLAKAGGIARAKRVAAVAEAHGMPCDVNGSLESAVGNAANIHFAFSTPAVNLPCVIPVSGPADSEARVSGRYFVDDVVSRSMSWVNGGVIPSDEPGLGITVEEDKLSEYRIN